MKKIEQLFNRQLFVSAAIMALFMLAACSKDGGGGGNDPFNPNGGNGGGNNSALVGKWTSVSATGTVGYTTNLGASLANAVNGSIATYDLTNVSVLQFEANGKVSLYDMGSLYDSGTYTFNGSALTLKNNQNQSETLNITLSGNEFTASASNTDIAALVAWAIGNAVLKANGYAGMTETGIQVSAANLTIKFQKQ